MSCGSNHNESGRAQADENTCTEKKKYASIYEINMLRCIFCLCEDACPKTLLFDYLKTLVASSYEREDFIYGRID
jgi:NADH-quinone oxidoreductase subunit I